MVGRSPMSVFTKSAPYGMRILPSMSLEMHRAIILIFTFLIYAAYHASRKVGSITKAVLVGENPADPGWAPFNAGNGKALLGDMDLAFLGAYAAAMFYVGHLGDKVNLRHFLSIGMFGSGFFVLLFGLGYFWNVHALPFFLIVRILEGFLQTTGWPGVVSVVANWFGKGRRGLIMGVWNAHTSVGNIVGAVVASSVLGYGWGWSGIVLGLMMMVMSVIVLLFLVSEPHEAGFDSPYDIDARAAEEPFSVAGAHRAEMVRDSEEGGGGKLATVGSMVLTEPFTGEIMHVERDRSVSFWDALRIPGVRTFALTLLFSKLVASTFLYWLPFYISTTQIAGRQLTAAESGNLSILFDVGGIIGGALAGHLSDVTGASATVAGSFVWLAIPFVYLYRTFGYISIGANIALMMVAGIFVSGPYALIVTAVAADLGTHKSLKGNEKALGTVTSIIDGMGSVGAALGPVITGYIAELPGEFENVFIMLYISAAIAGLLLSDLVYKEMRDIYRRRQFAAARKPGAEESLLGIADVAEREEER